VPVKTSIFGIFVALAVAVGAAGQSSTKATALNFTGHFILAGATGDLRFDPHNPKHPTLEVVQTADTLHVKSLEEDMLLPLDDREIQYTTGEGYAATALLKVKGKHLEITKDIQGADFPRIPKYHIHSVERWSLSGDSKTLKICGSADNPGGIVQFRKSGCQIFRRQ
jgi:hypothetical protein